MNRNPMLQGLYAITATQPDTSRQILERQVTQALAGGARLIQFRDKGSSWPQRLDTAQALVSLCRQANALLIINDDVELALAAGADGVHIGKDDTDFQAAREQLGPDAIIGVSCYNSLPLAQQAQTDGADYVAFGRFFPSNTKPQAIRCDLGILQLARSQLALPIVAIGGITPENGSPLIAAGADMLAVIDAIFGQPDIQAACKRFQPLFDPLEN